MEKLEENDYYTIVNEKLMAFENGDFRAKSWLNGFIIPKPDSPISIYAQKEMLRIKNKILKNESM